MCRTPGDNEVNHYNDRGKEMRRMLLKSSSSMFDPKEFTLVHLFLIIVMKVVKSSQSEYVEFLRSHSVANLASLMAASYCSM